MIFLFDGKTVKTSNRRVKMLLLSTELCHEFPRQSRSRADVFSNILRVENVMTRELCSVHGRL